MLGLLDERARRGQARDEERGEVAAARRRVGAQPDVGHERDGRADGGERARRRAARRPRAIGPASASRTCSASIGTGVVRGRRQRALAVLAKERGAVVDEPGPPPQTSRFGLRCVRSTFVTSASNQTTSAASSGSTGGSAGRRERQRAGQEVHAEVQAGARREQLLDLGVGLGVPELRRDVDDDELGHVEAERARELARDDLGDERALALAGAA